jgi:hypothetical protein
MKKALASILFVSLLLITQNVCSESLAEQIKARAGEINELKSLLNNPDSSVRIAAIDVMQNSEDIAMREMGFSAGINSSDEAVVAITIRNKFKEIKNFNIQLVLPSDAPEELKKFYNEKLGGQIGFSITSYDPATATFRNGTTYSNQPTTSTISGRVLHLRSYYGKGTFVLNEELMFVGEFSFSDAKFAAQIQLF